MLSDREKLGHIFLDQIVRRDCYQIRRLANNPPKTILDIGGNMGMFSMMSRILFPSARIITVEPCPETFERLKINLRFMDCQLENVALSALSRLSIMRGSDSGSNSVRADPNGGIRGMTLSEMCREWRLSPGTDRMLLKCDCEGGERQIIESTSDTALAIQCLQLSMEMHFSDGRGEKKWANAISRQAGEQWVDHLRSLGRDVRYTPDRLGGMLITRTY